MPPDGPSEGALRGFAARTLHQEPARLTGTLLAGDASGRRYHRFAGEGRSVVVMELPASGQPVPALPTTRGRVAPGAVAVEELPFLNVQRYLSAGGYPVPGILGEDRDAGYVAIEDLGDLTLEAAVSREGGVGRRALYGRAVALIAQLQHIGLRRPDAQCVAFRRRFDEALLLWELDHFREWLLERDRGVRLTADENAVLDAAFGRIAGALAGLPPVLVHRDFQSRNLMVQGQKREALRVIDFQDALLGPPVYDLVALLRDSYVDLPFIEVLDILSKYEVASSSSVDVDLPRHFHLQTVQRKLKDAGRFVFLDVVRGQPGYRAWIPVSLRYAGQALAALPELAGLREVLVRHIPELGVAAAGEGPTARLGKAAQP